MATPEVELLVGHIIIVRNRKGNLPGIPYPLQCRAIARSSFDNNSAVVVLTAPISIRDLKLGREKRNHVVPWETVQYGGEHPEFTGEGELRVLRKIIVFQSLGNSLLNGSGMSRFINKAS